MSTPLNPREIFLLERYSSVAYYQEMRDHFAAMLEAAEEALREFMRNLPPDYRSWHTSEQPDVSWGEVVLPNLRWTMQAVDDGLVQLKNGDFDGLSMAGNVRSAFAGMSREYHYGWMPATQQALFVSERSKCSLRSSNIAITALGDWSPQGLTRDEPRVLASRGPLNAPPTWPLYRLSPSVRIATNDKVPRDGIYLPDANHSAPQFMIKGSEAWEANVANSGVLDAPWQRQPSHWTLVERVADAGGGTPGANDPVAAGIRLRVVGGETCPLAGYWTTPAQVNSRRIFKAGDVMPVLRGDYGTTIWQWDEQQS